MNLVYWSGYKKARKKEEKKIRIQEGQKKILIQEGQEKRKTIWIQEGQEKKTIQIQAKNNPDFRKDRRKEKESGFKKAREKNNSDSRRPGVKEK